MTDNEIINDLEERIEFAKDFESDFTLIKIKGLKSTLDLINRQKAEIERLQKQLNNAEDLVNEKTIYITDLHGEIERLKERVKRQKKALFEQQSYTAELQAEVNRLRAKAEGAKEPIRQYGLIQARGHDKTRPFKLQIRNITAEAITEFAKRLCEGRVSNDPVVIAVQSELRECKLYNVDGDNNG